VRTVKCEKTLTDGDIRHTHVCSTIRTNDTLIVGEVHCGENPWPRPSWSCGENTHTRLYVPSAWVKTWN